MKKIIAAVCTLAMCAVLFAGCSAKDDTLIMATEAGFAPYEYMEGNEIVGIDVDIANEIAKAMGKKLKIQNMDFDGALAAVEKGKVDFAAAGISITDERKEKMDFTIEYATSKQVIVINTANKGVAGPSDFVKGKKIGVQQGTTADYYMADEIKAGNAACAVSQYAKYPQAALDLKNGKIDAIIMDSLPAEQMVKQNTDLSILPEELFTDKYAIAVKKGNSELLTELNKVLQKLVDDGKIDEYTLNHTTK